MQCGNISSHTSGAGCIYIQNTHVPHMCIYIYIYRQFSVFTTSMGRVQRAPKINKVKENQSESESELRDEGSDGNS